MNQQQKRRKRNEDQTRILDEKRDSTTSLLVGGEPYHINRIIASNEDDEDDAQQQIVLSSPSSPSSLSPQLPVVRLYHYRWFQLFMFSLLSFSNAWIWISLAPVATLVQKFYGIESFLVNLLSTIYMFVFIPGNPVCGVILERFGLRVTLLAGASLNMLGSWIRVAGSNQHNYYAVLFVGQCLCAAAQCFILHIPPLLAAFWFSPSERSLATSIGAVCNQLGIAVGFLVTTLLVNESNYRSQLAIVACICAAVSTVSGVLLLLFFKEKPLLPPSISQIQSPVAISKNNGHSRDQEEGYVAPKWYENNSFVSVLISTKKIFTNVHYLNLVIGFGVSQGCYYALSTLLDQLVEPFNYGTSVAGTLGFILTIAGIFGALVSGFIADKTHYHRALLRICFVMAALSIIGYTILLQRPGMFYPLCVVSGLFGFFITSLLPLSFELGVECTFDPNASSDLEALTGGFLMIAAQVFGIAFTFAMDALTRRGYIRMAEWIVAGVLCGSALLVAVGFHGRLKRLEYERIQSCDDLVETVDSTTPTTPQQQDDE